MLDSGCSSSIAPEHAAPLLNQLRDSNRTFTLGDANTKLAAGQEGDLIFRTNDDTQGTSVTFYCLKTGKMWLLSTSDLTKNGWSLYMRDSGLSFLVTPLPHLDIVPLTR